MGVDEVGELLTQSVLTQQLAGNYEEAEKYNTQNVLCKYINE